MKREDSPIVLFDGVCGFCNAAVRFIIAREPAGVLRFAALQSEIGRELIDRHNITVDFERPDTFVLIEEGEAYVQSTGALRVARRLKRPWCWLYAVIFIPRPVRDVGYSIIARCRYLLAGRKESCPIPTAAERERFLT